jgi:hypothetical protein
MTGRLAYTASIDLRPIRCKVQVTTLTVIQVRDVARSYFFAKAQNAAFWTSVNLLMANR